MTDALSILSVPVGAEWIFAAGTWGVATVLFLRALAG